MLHEVVQSKLGYKSRLQSHFYHHAKTKYVDILCGLFIRNRYIESESLESTLEVF